MSFRAIANKFRFAALFLGLVGFICAMVGFAVNISSTLSFFKGRSIFTDKRETDVYLLVGILNGGVFVLSVLWSVYYFRKKEMEFARTIDCVLNMIFGLLLGVSAIMWLVFDVERDNVRSLEYLQWTRQLQLNRSETNNATSNVVNINSEKDGILVKRLFAGFFGITNGILYILIGVYQSKQEICSSGRVSDSGINSQVPNPMATSSQRGDKEFIPGFDLAQGGSNVAPASNTHSDGGRRSVNAVPRNSIGGTPQIPQVRN